MPNSQKSRRIRHVFALVMAGGVFGLHTGCSEPAPPSGPGSGYLGTLSTSGTAGDWNDIDAAVLVGASVAEMAVVEAKGAPESDRREYVLTTVREEPALLVVVKERGGESGGVARVRLEATVGRYGERARERALMDAVASRLKDLAGVDYAPLAGE